MKNSSKLVSVLAVAVCGLALLAPEAKAGKKFRQEHPRRAEVLRRERNEVKKNDAAAADGKITGKQAAKLDRQDARIKNQEQAEAAANGGHITKSEQRQLNREENRVNRERNRMERRDARKADGGAPTTPAAAPAAPAAPAPTSN